MELDKHKLWLIFGIAIALLVVGVLFLYPATKESLAGQATRNAGTSKLVHSDTTLDKKADVSAKTSIGTNLDNQKENFEQSSRTGVDSNNNVNVKVSVPDTDGDGIIDTKDECPQVKGVAKLHGCPETTIEPTLNPEVLIGDLNADGCVNGADLKLLQDNFIKSFKSKTTGLKLSDGDITGDGVVDGSDLKLIQDYFIDNFKKPCEE